jgi:hypothetical protein
MCKKNSILLISLVLFSCCNNDKTAENSIVTVDLTQKYPEIERCLQDIADVKYIPLGSNETVLVDNRYDVVSIQNDHLVLSQSNNSILIFDGKGNPKTFINKQGQSGEEYTNIDILIVDGENEALFVYDGNLNRFLVYDMTGKYLRTVAVPKDIHLRDISNFDKDNLLVYDDFGRTYETQKNPFMLISKKDGHIVKKLETPIEKRCLANAYVMGKDYHNGVFSTPIRLQEDGGFLLTDLSTDTIYHLSTDLVLTPRFLRTPSVPYRELTITSDDDNAPLFLGFGISTHSYQFMGIITYMTYFETPLLYDKKENKIYQPRIYNDDYRSKKFISLEYYSNYDSSEGAMTVIPLSVAELMEAYEKGELKGELKEVASKLNEDDNPVLMVVKFTK